MARRTERELVQEAQYSFPYHYLDLEVDIYRLRFIEYRSLLQSVTERVIRLGPGGVLDAGCGDGRLCRELRLKGVDVTGIDYSEQAISFARAFNPGTRFVASDLVELDLGRTFDAVVLMETLEHVPPLLAGRMLEHLRAHLRPGGHLVVTVPSVNEPVTEKHYQHFSPASLHEFLTPYFRVESIEGYEVNSARRKLFLNTRRLTYLMYGVLEPLGIGPKVVDELYAYYERHIAAGPPARCSGLVAVCVRGE